MVDKPLYVWPFIFVYKLVTFILKVPILVIRFFSLGFFFTIYFTINFIINAVAFPTQYLFLGILYACYFVFHFVKYLGQLLSYTGKGFSFPFVIIYNRINDIGKKENKHKPLKIENKKVSNVFEGQKVKDEKKQENNEQLKVDAAFDVNKKKQEQFRASIDEDKLKGLASAKELEEVENNAKRQKEIDKRKIKLEAIEAKKRADADRKAEKALILEEKKRAKEEKAQKSKEFSEKIRKEEKEAYINENVKIEKVKFSDRINDVLEKTTKLPNNIKKYFVDSYNNLSFVKNIKNQKDISRQALLINFEGDDAKKNDKKVMYEYVGKNVDGKLTKGYFEAFSKVEVHSFLLSEGFEVYSIRTNKFIQIFYGTSGVNRTRIKTKDLIFFLTQLSTYIKAGIPLIEALKILSRQYKNKSYQRIFRSIIYDLTMGDNFSDALTKQGDAFPKLLVNMVKVSEMTGELPEALDDMADYYTEMDRTRKQMVTAMMYPSIILVIALAVVTFIMVFVVPRFVVIYETMDNARLPMITRMVMSVSTFLENNYIWLIIILITVLVVYRYLLNNVKLFRTMVQWLTMHIPVIGDVIVYNEITMFTKTFCSLLKHNVFITDSMEILNKITKNEIYKMIVLDTITNLARGEKISLAFKDHWAVPIPAYEMIVTGERTGQLPEMMGKVSVYYQEMHKNSVARIKSFIEPALIVFLTLIVGVIVLSVIIPMFGMYGAMGM